MKPTITLEDGTLLELEGERIVLAQEPEGRVTISFDDKGTGRQCGACQLCCRLLPIPVLNKPANTRCKAQKVGKGCMVYAFRPDACRVYACRWLADRETAGMKRPDRAHYVIDAEADKIRLVPHDGSVANFWHVIQVWADPDFPEILEDPQLRAYMDRMAVVFRMPTIIRWSTTKAVVAVPPAISSDRQWHFVNDAEITTKEQLEAAIATDQLAAASEGVPDASP